MLRRLIKVSAVVLGAGLLLAGCSPVKFGAAAITGNQRITIATLTTQVTNLSQAVKQYPGTISMSQAQETQETLSWLVRFQINEELARQAGITVTPAQAEAALAQIYAAAKASAQAQGLSNVTLDLILAANGIPPDLSAEVGRYQAINDQFIRQANGGSDTHHDAGADGYHRQAPARPVRGGQGPDDTDQPAVRPAELHPVPGRLRAQPGGSAPGAGEADPDGRADAGLLIVLVTSPRVAPGLLSWPAWQALRSASSVLASAGHPQLPALDEAGIAYRVVDDFDVELARARRCGGVAARAGC